MKKLNTTISMKNIKASLNINIGEISFKEESTRKGQDEKRNFSHKVAKDIKISLNSETEEIVFDIEALNNAIKEAVKDTVQAIEEVAEPVDNNEKLIISFCRDYLEGVRKPQSDAEYKKLLNVYFGYSIQELDNLQHSPEALLRRECKNYLVRKRRAAK